MRTRSNPGRAALWRLTACTGLALCLSTIVDARSIRGDVTGPDGFSVGGATVEVLDTENVAHTDPFGAFSISGVPEGTARLRVAAAQFEPVGVTVPPGESSVSIVLPHLQAETAHIHVVSDESDLRAITPGSLHVITSRDLKGAKPQDTNEMLRRVPGIHLREDSGPVAMRLNVGLRGLNPNRSRKVLMLEDGVPIALAPYGEPDMYYSPPIERMSSVEVLKGSGQIVHGPQTVGGVINFVTPKPPSKLHAEADIEGGQRGTFNGWASLGGSSRDQRFGWIGNYLHKQGDGWRQFYYDIEDLQGKVDFRASDEHSFAVKVGLYDETSNSTYLGLTTPMFEQDPNQNPVPSDTLGVERRTGTVSHTYVPNSTSTLNTTAFLYTTTRFWGRQDFDRVDRGRTYLGIAGDPTVQGGAIYLRDSAGNRNRQFEVFGLQSNFGHKHDHGRLSLGFRVLSETARDQRVNGPGLNARTGVIRDDEWRYGNAFAAYVQNHFKIGSRVTFTPGIRFVRYNQIRNVVRKRVDGEPTNVDISSENGITTAVPGLGFSVRAHDNVTLFAGLHRGFAPPATKVAITSNGDNLELDAELSVNYETGIRLAGQGPVSGEFVFFRMDFSNQIISAAESGGATTTITNGGATLHQGFESSATLHWNRFADFGGWLVTTGLRYTFLPTAEFTDNEIFGGNRLPYAPERLFGLLADIRRPGGLSFQLDVNMASSQFGDNRETLLPSVDGTIGQLPDCQVANLNVEYEIRGESWVVAPYFTVKNVLDELYISSRAPQGIQPGMFRQVNGGLRISF